MTLFLVANITVGYYQPLYSDDWAGTEGQDWLRYSLPVEVGKDALMGEHLPELAWKMRLERKKEGIIALENKRNPAD